ncbi:MAG: CBS domain-containing protein [Phycisphaerae bacterium]|nr:CBS domain-containing protein [Phycisphaerae bacterium]
MLVEHIMTRHVVSVRMDATLDTIRELFEARRFHHVVVLEERRLVGIISDRDLLRAVSPFAGTAAERTMDAASWHKRAHQIMHRSVITARADMNVNEAAALFLRHRISALPVIDDEGSCVGIVTLRDFLRWMLAEVGDDTCATKLAEEPKRAA